MSADQVAIVTGAGRGIGAETARLLAKNGYFVCINFRADEEAATKVVEQIRSQGGEALPVQADVSREDEILRLFSTVDDRIGRLTVLVNNAAIVRWQARVESLQAERIEKILATNVAGPFLCCREAIKRMSTKQGGAGGSIVNVSSVAARTGSPNEYVDYAASKAAVDTLTRGLAVEVAADGIRVNCVRPGFIYTDMHADGGEPGRVDRLAASIPLQRGGTAAEIARSIAWLVSDQASYVTGAIIDAAGGR